MWQKAPITGRIWGPDTSSQKIPALFSTFTPGDHQLTHPHKWPVRPKSAWGPRCGQWGLGLSGQAREKPFASVQKALCLDLRLQLWPALPQLKTSPLRRRQATQAMDLGYLSLASSSLLLRHLKTLSLTHTNA